MTKKKLLIVTPFGAAVAAMALSAVAYACTTFIGTFSVTGNQTGTVTATGTGSMTQTVNSTIAKTTHSTTAATVKVSTGANGLAVLPQGGYDINFYNSGPNGTVVGYTNHTSWNTDCMDLSSGVPSNGVNLGSVTVGSAGTITAALGGTLSGGTVTFTNAPAPNTDVNPSESSVCISDSSAINGNEAPITVI